MLVEKSEKNQRRTKRDGYRVRFVFFLIFQRSVIVPVLNLAILIFIIIIVGSLLLLKNSQVRDSTMVIQNYTSYDFFFFNLLFTIKIKYKCYV